MEKSNLECLPQLTGTEKQVKWGSDIRDDFIRNISEAEALLQWWEKYSPEQEKTVARLRANADEGKSGAVDEYNRFKGNVSAMAFEIGKRIRFLNAVIHMEGRSPSRLSAKGQQLEDEFGDGILRYKPRAQYRSERAYNSAVERRKKQKDAAEKIINAAKSYARQEQSASKWIDKREYTEKRKVKTSGNEILWDAE